MAKQLETVSGLVEQVNHIGLVTRGQPQGPLPERELYVSPLFRAARAYAERRCF